MKPKPILLTHVFLTKVISISNLFGVFCFVFVLVVINWSNYFGIGLMTLNRSLLQNEPLHHSLMKSS